MDKGPSLYQSKYYFNIIHNNFVGSLQIRQTQCNFITVNYFHDPKRCFIFHRDNNDFETFIMSYTFVHTLLLNQISVFFNS